MHSVKRDLAIGGAIGIMVLALAMAWGSPFVTTNNAHAQDQAQPQPQQPAQQQPDQAKSSTFTGTVLRDGGQYSLRDSSGEIFKLDDPERARPFEGKTVKVTGELDEQAKLIHVESIEGTTA